MKKYLQLGFILVLFSCSSNLHLNSSVKENLVVEDTVSVNIKIEKIINPYKEEMEAEMNVKIGYLLTDLAKDRSAVETKLGNLVADIVFESGFQDILKMDSAANMANTFCLINKGGLRSSLYSGEIKRSHIYELMPFDNEIVVLKISAIRVKKMLNYLFLANGQPISNAKVLLSSNLGKLFIGGVENNFDQALYIITSDYLANGGDKMSFFLESEKHFQTGKLIRNEIIDYFSENDSINWESSLDRIQFIK